MKHRTRVLPPSIEPARHLVPLMRLRNRQQRLPTCIGLRAEHPTPPGHPRHVPNKPEQPASLAAVGRFPPYPGQRLDPSLIGGRESSRALANGAPMLKVPSRR